MAAARRLASPILERQARRRVVPPKHGHLLQPVGFACRSAAPETAQARPYQRLLAIAVPMTIAKEKGIADPAKDAKCLKCHSTAGSIDKSLIASLTVEEGVSCESCHGPGSVYKSMKIMKSRELCLENGLILPVEEVCKKCHNAESPTFKSFNFEESIAKIAHPKPKSD